jgi:butyrate kinase
MFSMKERCELQPLAKSGVLAKPFVVEVAINFLNLKKVEVSVLMVDDDGLEKRVATGVYEVKAEMLEGLKDRLRQELGQG